MFRKSSNNPWISPSGFLNTGSFAQIGGTEPVGTRFQGMLGQTIVCSNADALKLSDTSVGTLYQGVYQLVKFNSAVARGALCFWDTLANNGLNDYEVTDVVTAAAVFKAGIAVCAMDSGEYGWIQVAGLASGLFRASVTSKVLGNLVVMTSLTDGLLDAIADATDYFDSVGDYKLTVGTAYQLPADASVTRINLDLGSFVQNVVS